MWRESPSIKTVSKTGVGVHGEKLGGPTAVEFFFCRNHRYLGALLSTLMGGGSDNESPRAVICNQRTGLAKGVVVFAGGTVGAL